MSVLANSYFRSRDCRRRRRRQSGQGLTEFALLAPVAMIVLFCVIQAGIMIYAYSFVSYAARLGARYASVHGTLSGSTFTSSTVTAYVRALSSGLNTSQLSATASSSPSQAPGGTATITVTYTYTPFAFITPSTVSLSSTAQTTINY